MAGVGRIDIVDMEHGDAILAQAYLHPALKLRVVPTSLAPEHAIIPQNFLQRVEEGSSSASEKYHRPLQPHMTRDNPLGHVIPSDKACRNNKYYMDVVFCSLGWISFTHHSKFALKPYCVQGSVYSHRPALYPVNLFKQLRNDQTVKNDEDDDKTLTLEERRAQLDEASQNGRHWSRLQNSGDSRRQHPEQQQRLREGGQDDAQDWDETDFY
jgi:hypothetical protein